MTLRHIFLSVLTLAMVLAAQTAAPNEVEITSEPHHHPVLENKYVRVFKVEVARDESTLMHWHRHDYVFVTLGAALVENDVAGKPPATLRLQDGETRFLAGGFAHVAKNLSDQPFRNITIELMQDDQTGAADASKWDEERGLHILNGGTVDILFVKDGARASELQLQAGGVVPRHHHAGPHLVVAVTDLELRSDVEGKGSSVKQLKAGDIAWVEGGFTHTLTNVGKQDAKLITLEFQ
jgi:quercetin dioxygenase-like cupin family protein